MCDDVYYRTQTHANRTIFCSRLEMINCFYCLCVAGWQAGEQSSKVQNFVLLALVVAPLSCLWVSEWVSESTRNKTIAQRESWWWLCHHCCSLKAHFLWHWHWQTERTDPIPTQSHAASSKLCSDTNPAHDRTLGPDIMSILHNNCADPQV